MADVAEIIRGDRRPWRGSVRAHRGWLLVAFKDERGEWVERSTKLRDAPENWAAAKAMLVAIREDVASRPPVPPPADQPPPFDPLRVVGRNSRNRSFKRRRGEVCEVCGWVPRPPLRPSAVNAHHVRPLAEGGTHDDENRIVLCPNHHAVAHALHRVTPAATRDELLAQLRVWEAPAPSRTA